MVLNLDTYDISSYILSSDSRLPANVNVGSRILWISAAVVLKGAVQFNRQATVFGGYEFILVGDPRARHPTNCGSPWEFRVPIVELF